MAAVFQDSDIAIFGETHGDEDGSAHRWPARHMKDLKDAGVTTVYMEAFERHDQRDLDRYCATGQMSRALEFRLKMLDVRHFEQTDERPFTTIVKQAHAHGMRIRSVDERTADEQVNSEDQDGELRVRNANRAWFNAIVGDQGRLPGEKAVVLAGSAHTHTMPQNKTVGRLDGKLSPSPGDRLGPGIPGLAEMLTQHYGKPVPCVKGRPSSHPDKDQIRLLGDNSGLRLHVEKPERRGPQPQHARITTHQQHPQHANPGTAPALVGGPAHSTFSGVEQLGERVTQLNTRNDHEQQQAERTKPPPPIRHPSPMTGPPTHSPRL
ncbi:ChaN family lipoprotein [Kitasatospora sp. GAS1066B]|uniref:ChaN family lipoprotein n=1 Tax=Kitasatospora sp. GAS1066B TaxID=3156271 RepID=UPI00351278CC